MKTDLKKLITFIWMFFTGYLMYAIYEDVHYMTDLVHAYIKMVIDHVRP